MLLVGTPGAGKSVAVSTAEEFLIHTDMIKVAPTSMTKASMVDRLAESQRGEIPNIYHSLNICAGELGALLPAYDQEYMNTLNVLYDCPGVYHETRRTSLEEGGIKLDNPSASILTGTQPAFLGNLLPDTAFEMGFCSRFVMVFDETKLKMDLFAEYVDNETLRKKLQRDLGAICQMKGEFIWDPEAAQLMQHWVDVEAEPSAPQHPRLQHYGARRHINIIKLSPAFSASESNEMVIYKHHVEQAIDILMRAENNMGQIFKLMTKSSMSGIIEDTFTYIWQAYTRTQRPIGEQQISNYLLKAVSPNQINFTISSMVNANMIKEAAENQMVKMPGGTVVPSRYKTYIPVPKHEHGGIE